MTEKLKSCVQCEEYLTENELFRCSVCGDIICPNCFAKPSNPSQALAVYDICELCYIEERDQ